MKFECVIIASFYRWLMAIYSVIPFPFTCVCQQYNYGIQWNLFIVSDVFDFVLSLHPSISNVTVFQSFEVGRYLYW